MRSVEYPFSSDETNECNMEEKFSLIFSANLNEKWDWIEIKCIKVFWWSLLGIHSQMKKLWHLTGKTKITIPTSSSLSLILVHLDLC